MKILARPLFVIESPKGFIEDTELYDEFKAWFKKNILDYDLCVRQHVYSKTIYFNFDVYGPVNTEFTMQRVVKLVTIYLKNKKIIE